MIEPEEVAADACLSFLAFGDVSGEELAPASGASSVMTFFTIGSVGFCAPWKVVVKVVPPG